MKRQRSTKVVPTNDTEVEGSEGREVEETAKRKQAEEAVVVAEERGGSCLAAAVAESMARMEEYWPWMRGTVDEHMSWSYISLPDWDLKAHSDLCNDDCWDYDDLWGLKAIMEIPNE